MSEEVEILYWLLEYRDGKLVRVPVKGTRQVTRVLDDEGPIKGEEFDFIEDDEHGSARYNGRRF